MDTREILREEIKHLKKALIIDVKTKKLSSIKDCREAFVTIVLAKAQEMSQIERLATEEMKERYNDLLLEHQLLKDHYVELLEIYEKSRVLPTRKPFFKFFNLFGGK